MSANPKTRIMIVDDHPVVREGFARFIEVQEDMTICGMTASRVETLDMIGIQKPDVVILDLGLKDCDGLDLASDITRLFPDVAILVVSVRDEMLYAMRAMRQGARGYVNKGEDREHVLAAIREIRDGGFYFSRSVQRQMFHLTGATGPKTQAEESPLKKLTDRELQILRLMGSGFSTVRIAKHLNLSVKTVDTHRLHIKAKLSTPTMPELMRLAVHWVNAEGGS